jgi:hypothetical protein
MKPSSLAEPKDAIRLDAIGMVVSNYIWKTLTIAALWAMGGAIDLH